MIDEKFQEFSETNKMFILNSEGFYTSHEMWCYTVRAQIDVGMAINWVFEFVWCETFIDAEVPSAPKRWINETRLVYLSLVYT